MSRRLKLYLIPVLILLAFTLPHLDQGEFRRDTVRYAAIGHYMWNVADVHAKRLKAQCGKP